jgi:hypothetical protein
MLESLAIIEAVSGTRLAIRPCAHLAPGSGSRNVAGEELAVTAMAQSA